jgi:hypothetical protein
LRPTVRQHAHETRRPTRPKRPDGRAVPVRFDAATLLRILRHLLSDGGSTGSFFTPPSVPGFLADVLAGRLAALAPTLADCLGAERIRWDLP